MAHQNEDVKQAREDLGRQILRQRREFLKSALITTSYVAPIALSFAAADLARATACPGAGNCGKSEWAHTM